MVTSREFCMHICRHPFSQWCHSEYESDSPGAAVNPNLAIAGIVQLPVGPVRDESPVDQFLLNQVPFVIGVRRGTLILSIPLSVFWGRFHVSMRYRASS